MISIKEEPQKVNNSVRHYFKFKNEDLIHKLMRAFPKLNVPKCVWHYIHSLSNSNIYVADVLTSFVSHSRHSIILSYTKIIKYKTILRLCFTTKKITKLGHVT